MGTLRLRFADRTFQGPYFHLTSIDSGKNRLPGPHSHDYPEIFWITRGRCRHWINDREVGLDAGALVLMRAEDRHALKPDRGAFRFTNLAIAPGVFDDLRTRYAGELSALYGESATPLVRTLDGAALDLVNGIARRLAVGPHSRFALDRALLELWEHCLPESRAAASDLPDWLHEALLRVNEPEVFQRGVAGMVAAAGRSHAHVSRTCRRHLGETPSAIVNGARLRRAAHMLRLSSRSVLEIAMDCGFENPAQFHRIFKAGFGTSPGRYRRSRLH
ncbi:MAG: AraC family transcriptional regulator [Puniceicoccaceae bacterium]